MSQTVSPANRALRFFSIAGLVLGVSTLLPGVIWHVIRGSGPIDLAWLEPTPWVQVSLAVLAAGAVAWAFTFPGFRALHRGSRLKDFVPVAISVAAISAWMVWAAVGLFWLVIDHQVF